VKLEQDTEINTDTRLRFIEFYWFNFIAYKSPIFRLGDYYYQDGVGWSLKEEKIDEFYRRIIPSPELRAGSVYYHIVIGDGDILVSNFQHNLARGYARRGEIALAARQFQAAINTFPDNVNSHYDLASVYVQQGDSIQAEKHFRQTLRIDPRNPAASSDLAKTRPVLTGVAFGSAQQCKSWVGGEGEVVARLCSNCSVEAIAEEVRPLG